MSEELEKIKAACTLAWQAKVPVTLTWEQAAAVLDALTVTGDMAAEARVAELEAEQRWTHWMPFKPPKEEVEG